MRVVRAEEGDLLARVTVTPNLKLETKLQALQGYLADKKCRVEGGDLLARVPRDSLDVLRMAMEHRHALVLVLVPHTLSFSKTLLHIYLLSAKSLHGGVAEF